MDLRSELRSTLGLPWVRNVLHKAVVRVDDAASQVLACGAGLELLVESLGVVNVLSLLDDHQESTTSSHQGSLAEIHRKDHGDDSQIELDQENPPESKVEEQDEIEEREGGGGFNGDHALRQTLPISQNTGGMILSSLQDLWSPEGGKLGSDGADKYQKQVLITGRPLLEALPDLTAAVLSWAEQQEHLRRKQESSLAGSDDNDLRVDRGDMRFNRVEDSQREQGESFSPPLIVLYTLREDPDRVDRARGRLGRVLSQFCSINHSGDVPLILRCLPISPIVIVPQVFFWPTFNSKQSENPEDNDIAALLSLLEMCDAVPISVHSVGKAASFGQKFVSHLKSARASHQAEMQIHQEIDPFAPFVNYPSLSENSAPISAHGKRPRMGRVSASATIVFVDRNLDLVAPCIQGQPRCLLDAMFRHHDIVPHPSSLVHPHDHSAISLLETMFSADRAKALLLARQLLVHAASDVSFESSQPLVGNVSPAEIKHLVGIIKESRLVAEQNVGLVTLSEALHAVLAQEASSKSSGSKHLMNRLKELENVIGFIAGSGKNGVLLQLADIVENLGLPFDHVWPIVILAFSMLGGSKALEHRYEQEGLSRLRSALQSVYAFSPAAASRVLNQLQFHVVQARDQLEMLGGHLAQGGTHLGYTPLLSRVIEAVLNRFHEACPNDFVSVDLPVLQKDKPINSRRSGSASSRDPVGLSGDEQKFVGGPDDEETPREQASSIGLFGNLLSRGINTLNKATELAARELGNVRIGLNDDMPKSSQALESEDMVPLADAPPIVLVYVVGGGFTWDEMADVRATVARVRDQLQLQPDRPRVLVGGRCVLTAPASFAKQLLDGNGLI